MAVSSQRFVTRAKHADMEDSLTKHLEESIALGEYLDTLKT
jgi:hypothetical protein